MVAGKRYNYTDPKVKEIMNMVTEVTASMAPRPSLGFLFPALRNIFPSIDYVKENCDKVRTIKSFLRNAIEQHRREFDENNIKDFIDSYLNEIKVSNRSPIFTDYNNPTFYTENRRRKF